MLVLAVGMAVSAVAGVLYEARERAGETGPAPPPGPRSIEAAPPAPSVAIPAEPTPKIWTVAGRVQQYDHIVRRRLVPAFRGAQVPYPPTALVFIVLKAEKTLEVHAAGPDGKFRPVKSYPVLAASGEAGPKLREGDYQVPEGLYRIESLNPNSLYHLSLRINYPNEFDRQHAREENRSDLGGDIMIHGNALSAGCLAMGDPASEDLFVLAALTGYQNIRVIMCPLDLRVHDAPPLSADSPPWLGPLYRSIKEEISRFERITDAAAPPNIGREGYP